MNASDRIAWHYTTGTHYPLIVSDGALRASATITPKGETPILWFSLALFWEPTAQKAMADIDGTRQALGMQGTYRAGGGLIRFGLPASNLIKWPRLGSRAGIAPRMRKALEQVGIRQGANPREWCGTFDDVDIKQCFIDVFNGESWERIQGGAA